MNGSAVPRTDQLLSVSVVSSANHIATARLAYRDGEAATGNGPDKPVADNGSEDGRRKNRRTDFELVEE